MTQLTQEEKEYLESPIDDTALEIIRRLSARVEELSNKVSEAQATGVHVDRFNQLQSNLSALLSAVEPIVAAIKDFTLSDEQGICDEVLMHNEGLKDIKAGDLRTLNQVVRKIKGEKG